MGEHFLKIDSQKLYGRPKKRSAFPTSVFTAFFMTRCLFAEEIPKESSILPGTTWMN
jgi:hypothetical protein